ncbi:lysophospholipid acyltransferase family protein [Hydrogenimonas thermophila]|uniref:lysophospholipid acyltransferase family protein n=1 Tax=Hydrogenimonas thermophila TaxID=223786 RepID=UPI002936DA92|nr:lysophospholipid acyltransferase family protein [Hydrogenimonas thermophila]WOE69619.1 lysophospholipid acyltransferase family protein [Hydrogenimonas thermophila]WOE72133.1 lysophospholipid acyltransferase family protein [Hydrogenimonas thermophila]
MQLIKCLLSLYTFLLFWGLIALLVMPSLLLYFIVYPFKKHPEDVFQWCASIIFKIFFKLQPLIILKFKLPSTIPNGVVFVATHQSSLDYPLLGSFIPRYLTITNMNTELIPFVSYVSKLIGVRYMNSKDLGKISAVYKELEDALKENRNIIIFPEGTRGDGKRLKPFKKSAFRLAKNCNKPIVPIIIDGTGKVVAKGDPCFKTVKRTEVLIKMLEPVYPENFSSEDEMLQFVKEKMEYKLHRNNDKGKE